MKVLPFLVVGFLFGSSCAFCLSPVTNIKSSGSLIAVRSSSSEWKGEVTSSKGGKINGCTLQQVEGSVTQYIVTIDGCEADLSRFGEAIYKKLIQDAKQQRFQGFRPGTIPPHLEPTYRAFAMDECARETVLEALQQNNVRPFESTRSEMELNTFCIPPPIKKKNKNKKRKKAAVNPGDVATPQEETEWFRFETMKEAVDAGWRPGQSFSFVAENVKGQRVKDQSEIDGATPLGLNF